MAKIRNEEIYKSEELSGPDYIIGKKINESTIEETLLHNLSMCFSDTQNPILIFCKWEDVLGIKKDFITKVNMAAVHGQFKEREEQKHLNFFDCTIYGKHFFFIDERQRIEFLELSKAKSL